MRLTFCLSFHTPKLILLLAFCVSTHYSYAQEYSYTQYNIKEGLAGSTVYCSVQDKDGFMWFGTETGLSRFDGSKFKNFTTEDGLTDNEILKMFCDSKGRLWLSLFKKDLCYYYKGKIYNRYNDSMLSHLHLTDVAWQVCEDDHGNILIMEQKKLHKIDRWGRAMEINRLNGQPIESCITINKAIDGNFLILSKGTLYELKENNSSSILLNIHLVFSAPVNACLSNKYLIWVEDSTTFKTLDLNNQKITSYFFSSPTHVSFNLIHDSLLCSNTSDGFRIYNIANGSIMTNLLPGKTVSAVCMDNENDFWCTTLGSGIFRVNSLDFKNLFFFNKAGKKVGVYSIIHGLDNKLFIGTDDGNIFEFSSQNPSEIQLFHLFKNEVKSRVLSLAKYNKKNILAGCDGSVQKLVYPYSKVIAGNALNVKSIYKINDDSFLIANRNSLLLFNPALFKVTDTLFKEWATTVFYKNDTIYAGTLDGLLILDRNKHTYFPGNTEPLLKNKITTITNTSDGIIWMATYGAGVIGYYHGKVIANITEKNGLTSNICRCINANGNTLWVGTDKGLNRITLSQKPYRITKITSADALMSDIINTIYIDNGFVYVGTPEGITYFNGKKIVSYSRCDLRITQMMAGQDTLESDANNFILNHKNNDISFAFSGISFKSAGEIHYYYRLNGLDTSWQTTTQNFINYTTLPSGDYVFQLKAVNKFGVESNTINVQFEVAEQLWEKGWFKFLIAAITLILIWFIVRLRIRYINKRNEEKLATMQHITELEQMALKSQMNPHFIFNSLNSIQQYVMDKDVEGANKFITGFSKLIRNTLEFSARQRISITEEIEYISTYLTLERERLVNKFTFNIFFKGDVNYSDIFIPPMILQPYVENSVRHGIRYRKDNNGVIDISIEKQNGSLFVTIEDNGVGRSEAAKYKSKNIIHYQSKGMSLTASRIEMMNKQKEGKMKVLVEDLEENDIPKGTKVTIIFPIEENG